MRRIDYLVLHCSATREGQELPPEALERAHRLRGFNGTGYHYYIRRDGTTVGTRPLKLVGAHVKGYNKYSIGICYEGGWMLRGMPATRVLRSSARLCGHWWHGCCAAFPRLASVVIATSVPT